MVFMAHIDSALVRQQTFAWLNSVVVGLNLCPFARPVISSETLRVEVVDGSDHDSLARSFLAELDRLQQSDESEIATTLLVVPTGLESFEDYLDFVDLANQLIEQVGLLGTLQLATFHPDYLFDGEPEMAVSHFTNRSPHPMLPTGQGSWPAAWACRSVRRAASPDRNCLTRRRHTRRPTALTWVCCRV